MTALVHTPVVYTVAPGRDGLQTVIRGRLLGPASRRCSVLLWLDEPHNPATGHLFVAFAGRVFERPDLAAMAGRLDLEVLYGCGLPARYLEHATTVRHVALGRYLHCADAAGQLAQRELLLHWLCLRRHLPPGARTWTDADVLDQVTESLGGLSLARGSEDGWLAKRHDTITHGPTRALAVLRLVEALASPAVRRAA